MRTFLFVCKANAGRSQMAEAFFNKLSKRDIARSAGIEPDETIHPDTVRLMEEIGIDVRAKRPKPLAEETMELAHSIIVMDPVLLSAIPQKYQGKTVCWRIEGLAGKSMTQVRKVRDEIRERIELLLKA